MVSVWPSALTVILESPKGTLLHGHRTNAAFTLTIRQGDGPIKHARALLLARMPQYDQHLPGGHGPANDPEVQGLVARPVGPGRYIIPTVAFTMAGPWLLEIHVQQGAETYKTYAAAYVGEGKAHAGSRIYTSGIGRLYAESSLTTPFAY